MSFEVILTPEAEEDLEEITDRRTVEAIESKLRELETEPNKRGKPLHGPLEDFRSIRAAGQRYRIIFEVFVAEKEVSILVIGIRKEGDKRDVYRKADRRLG